MERSTQYAVSRTGHRFAAHSAGIPAIRVESQFGATVNKKRIRWRRNQPNARSAKVPTSFKLLNHDDTGREIIVEAKDLMKTGIFPTDGVDQGIEFVPQVR
jgi:hypothetical protein